MELSIRFLALFITGLFLVSCGSDQKNREIPGLPDFDVPSATPPPVSLEPEIPVENAAPKELSRLEVLHQLDHAKRDRSIMTPYVLIAGGGDSASFAQEIVDQKRLWIRLGVPERRIACFYSVPTEKDFAADEEQFRALARELSMCYPASPKLVFNHLRESVSNDEPLYLYVSSHGSPPYQETLDGEKMSEVDRLNAAFLVSQVPALEQFTISLDSLPNGASIGRNEVIGLLKKKKYQPTDLLFTPRYLRQALDNKGESRHERYMVFQGCYSGGFVDGRNPAYRKDTLRGMRNITVITASRWDRASFGCGPGRHRTIFGETFNRLIVEKQTLAPELKWKRLHTELVEQIRRIEHAVNGLLARLGKELWEPSEPLFYTN